MMKSQMTCSPNYGGLYETESSLQSISGSLAEGVKTNEVPGYFSSLRMSSTTMALKFPPIYRIHAGVLVICLP
jgi:hypothetical protein